MSVITVDAQKKRTVSKIRSTSDDDLVEFYNDIGHAIGLSNSILLYERAFLLVEGSCEATAVPIIYNNLYGRSMREDGIIVVNLHTCDAWESILKMLLVNRLAMTHLLLDSDCKQAAAGKRITLEVLQKMPHAEQFINSQVTFIGKKEFEDAFSSKTIAEALNQNYPQEDGISWSCDEIEALKVQAVKFSEELTQCVKRGCERKMRSSVSKHSVARSIAARCLNAFDVPAELLTAINSVRAVAGLTS